MTRLEIGVMCAVIVAYGSILIATGVGIDWQAIIGCGLIYGATKVTSIVEDFRN